jgi:hypothetical protein
MGDLVKRFQAGVVASPQVDSLAKGLQKVIKSEPSTSTLRELSSFLDPRRSASELIDRINEL